MEAVVLQASHEDVKPSEWVRNLILSRLTEKAAEPLVPDPVVVERVVEPKKNGHPIGHHVPVRCNRGFCQGVIKANGRCFICNQKSQVVRDDSTGFRYEWLS